jgi:hypothetical protein
MMITFLGVPSADLRQRVWVPGVLALLPLLVPIQAGAEVTVHHDLRVTVHPEPGTLQAEDTLTLPGAPGVAEFSLHAGLAPEVSTVGASVEPVGTAEGAVPLTRYRLHLPPGSSRVTVRYAGSIRHSITDTTTDGGPPMPTTAGLIDPSGVYLDRGSGWYPDVGSDRLTFALTVRLPASWEAVSQGTSAPVDSGPGVSAVRWDEPDPQNGIYLVAAPFTVYRQATPVGEAEVYLRTPDPELARRYLDATGRYLETYSRLIGPYPYGKFALVENAWETGFGMPSFTLIGSRVIRLPFILDSSYPHEILHNWWGNSVYVDYASGNWAEGLTSYLADHLMQEERGAGASYRRSALQKYADYVAEAEDFPLTAFRGRHGEASQAVGYNKALMVFHMLRREIGDRAFVHGLRRFYQQQRFRTASWAELQQAFEAASGRDLGGFFGQWLDRTGAPVLKLEDVTVAGDAGGYRVTGRISQTQSGPPYRLRVPVAVQVEGQADARVQTVDLDGREIAFAIETTAAPLRLQVDPDYDLFRRLDPAEIPTSFGRLFGAPVSLFVLPAAAPADLGKAYRALALDWGRGPGALVMDTAIQALPTDRPVWVLGWENRWRSAVATALAAEGGALTGVGADLGGESVPRAGHTLALALPLAGAPALALGWTAADDPGAVASLARKLRHYGKYSYVAFATPEMRAVRQGQWPVLDSPLSVALQPAGAAIVVRTPPMPPLTAVAAEESARPE